MEGLMKLNRRSILSGAKVLDMPMFHSALSQALAS